MNNLHKLSIAVFLLLGLNSAQAQVNACSVAAPSLVFTGGVSCVTGTTVGATADFTNTAYCTTNNGPGVADRDVWYQFTTPPTLSGCWTFNLQRGTVQGDLMLRVFKTCSTVVGSSYVCSGNNYVDVSSSSFTATDWTANTTYYLQVTARSTAANTGIFNLCVTQSSAQASNDACATPMAIGSVPQQTGNNTAGCNYTYNAPADANVTPGQLCAITLENIAWYSFTALGNGSIVLTFQNIQCNGAGNGFQLGVFQGNSCGSWTNLGCAAASGGTVTLTITNVTAGQKFYMALDGNAGSNCHFTVSGTNIIPLPVEMISFTAKQISDQVLLEWSTGSEKNNDFFNVERSVDGLNFETIGSRKGAGNSSSVINYELTDHQPNNSTIYYRIKQTDLNGRYSFSEMIAIKIKRKTELLTSSPNPNTGISYFQFESPQNGTIYYEIINVLGQVKKSGSLPVQQGLNNIELTFEELDAGIYFSKFQSEFLNLKTQFIKK